MAPQASTDAPFTWLERGAAAPARNPDWRRSIPATIALILSLAGCTGPRQLNAVNRIPSLRVADAALVGGAPEVALRIADLTLARNPRHAEALVAKGDALYAMGLREEARPAYRQAVDLDPKLGPAQVGLGRTLVQSDPTAAEAAFLAAVSARPDDSAALNDLGIARDLLGRHNEAQEAYRRALAIAPGAADVKVNLGLSLALTGDRAAAVEVLREAAAVPAVAQGRAKELAAALTLAGDDAGARQVLTTRSIQVPQQPLVASREEPVAVEPKQDKPVATRSPGRPERDDPDTPIEIAKAPVATIGRADLRPLPETMIAMAPARVRMVHGDTAAADTPGPAPEPAERAPETGAFVQLASLHSVDDARYEWRRLSRRLPDLLGHHTPVIMQADALGQTYWCLRTFGFADLADATEMCAAAHGASGLRCWARAAS
jgi:Flp pilus assembly protein TadD